MRWNLVRPLALPVALLTIAVSVAPSQAQRANLHSNTARGGVDVEQVAGRKVGNVTTRGNIIGHERANQRTAGMIAHNGCECRRTRMHRKHTPQRWLQ